MPLDASEEDLLKDDPELIKKSLCSSGWNLTGKIHPATMGRAFLVAHLIREEVLEICLGQKLPPEMLNMRIDDVRQRIERSFADLPDHLRMPLTKDTLAQKDAWDIACVAQVQLQWIHHKFLLEQFDHPGRDEDRVSCR